MLRFQIALTLALGLAAPAALADAIPPPTPHTKTQDRLRGMWQEQGCHTPQPILHHSAPCPVRTLTFGDTTLAVVTTTGVLDRTEVTAVAAKWTEVSADESGAVIQPDIGTESWAITFAGADAFAIAAGAYPQTQFKRVKP